MNFANKLGEHFQHLHDLGAKYADYQRININQMDFREPTNAYEVITEGTPVLVVKVGLDAHAFLLN